MRAFFEEGKLDEPMQAQPQDSFSRYEAGLTKLLERLGQDHPDYNQVLTYQQRLIENLTQTRHHGDTDTRQAVRSEIIAQLNKLALSTINISFNDLCQELDGPLPVKNTKKHIQLIIEGIDFTNFTNNRRDLLIATLATILDVPTSEVIILKVQKGSIRVTIEIPKRALSRLSSLSAADIARLIEVGVTVIEIDKINVMRLTQSEFAESRDIPLRSPSTGRIQDHVATTQIDDQKKQGKVLDAAIKKEIKVGESTVILVLIRDSDSKGLRVLLHVESDYMLKEEDVRSSHVFQLYYPVDELGNLLPTNVEIVITALDFSPSSQSKIIEIDPTNQKDELDPVEFMLTPLIPGELQIIVEVYQSPDEIRKRIGSKPIRTVSKENPSPYAKHRVMSLMFHTFSIGSQPTQNVTHINHYGDVIQGDKVGSDKVGRDKIIIPKDPETIPHQIETPLNATHQEKGGEENRASTTHIDNRSGGVYFEGGNVELEGDVVGRNQTKNVFHHPTSSPTILGMIALVAIVALVVIVAVVGQREPAFPEPTPTITMGIPPTATLPSILPTVAPTIVPSTTPKPTSTLKLTKIPTTAPTSSPTPACQSNLFVTLDVDPRSVKINGQAILTVTIKNLTGTVITSEPQINILILKSEFGRLEPEIGQKGIYTYHAPEFEASDEITFRIDDEQCPIEQTVSISVN